VSAEPDDEERAHALAKVERDYPAGTPGQECWAASSTHVGPGAAPRWWYGPSALPGYAKQ